MAGAVAIRGLAELQRDLAGYDKDLRKRLRKRIAAAAEPVRVGAQSNSTATISHLGPRWGLMRIGVTNTSVYVAPKSHRRGGSPRPNLGTLLFNAMQSALDENSDLIARNLEAFLDELAAEHGF